MFKIVFNVLFFIFLFFAFKYFMFDSAIDYHSKALREYEKSMP